ncbi:hypothetical protein JCM10212_000553 [Sporobolomyces blumeae]
MGPRYSTASATDDDDDDAELNDARPLARLDLDDNVAHTLVDPRYDEDESQEDEEEEEEAWDEVEIPHHDPLAPSPDPTRSQLDDDNDDGKGNNESIEIVISKAANDNHRAKPKKPTTTAQDRQLRQSRHKVHVLTLLAAGLVRNKWINDRELQARLLSHLPTSLHTSLVSITRQRYPNPRDRSRLFEQFVQNLVEWWSETFDVVQGEGATERRSTREVDEEVETWRDERQELIRRDKDEDAATRATSERAKKGKGKGRAIKDDDHDESRWAEWPWDEPQVSFDRRRKLLRQQAKASTSSSSSSSAPVPSTSSAAAAAGPPPPPPRVRPWADSPRRWDALSSPPLQSLRSAASKLKGSRRTSIELLASLLRALEVPCRLVVSLQAVEWRSDSASGAGGGGGKQSKAKEVVARKGTGAKRSKGKGKGKAKVETIELSSSGPEDETDEDGTWQDGRGKLNYKIPKPNLRKSATSSKGRAGGSRRMAGWEKERMMLRSPSPDVPDPSTPPTQWLEVYSRYLKEWVPVDPVRRLIRCKGKMEPRNQGKASRNVLCYVVGFEEDGSAHDITPRYTRAYNNVTSKLRVPTSSKAKKESGGRDWFGGVVRSFGRGYELNRDKQEEDELWNRRTNEPFPSSVGGFKNHPNFVLEQHLHRDEALMPGTRSLGLFKSTTPVFPRSAVVTVKSVENWYRTGRTVLAGEIPRKFVKGRAVTINARRREELVKMDGGEVDEQPLYSEDQTEVYTPDPVVDGKIPKNNFGNIDLFVPTMLPAGAVHLPSKVAVKCAKMLGIDYAEAIIGFEFRQRRATPTMSGVVVAEENADLLRQAILTLEQQTLEKTLLQTQDRVLKRWKKLITGLRIRQRLKGQFKEVESGIVGQVVHAASVGGTGSSKGTPRPLLSATSSPESVAGDESGDGVRQPPSPARSRRRKRSPPSPTLSPSSTTLSSPALTASNDVSPPPRKRRSVPRSSLRTADPVSTRSAPLAEAPASNGLTTRRLTRATTRSTTTMKATRSNESVEDLTGSNDGSARRQGGVEGPDVSLKVRLRRPSANSTLPSTSNSTSNSTAGTAGTAGTGSGRPTRASAQKANLRFKPQDDEEDDEVEGVREGEGEGEEEQEEREKDENEDENERGDEHSGGRDDTENGRVSPDDEVSNGRAVEDEVKPDRRSQDVQLALERSESEAAEGRDDVDGVLHDEGEGSTRDEGADEGGDDEYGFEYESE